MRGMGRQSKCPEQDTLYGKQEFGGIKPSSNLTWGRPTIVSCPYIELLFPVFLDKVRKHGFTETLLQVCLF